MELPIELFFSFAEEDENLREKLERQLAILEREDRINIWHKGKIGAGEELSNELAIHLNKAQIILLLISASYIASHACYDIEMKRAMERHGAGEARVIPIILHAVDLEIAQFARLQVLPMNKKPVSSWPKLNDALFHVAECIRKVVEDLQKSQQADDSLEEIMDSQRSQRLYNTLVRLDYREQVRVFQQFKNEKRQVGAFFIHGAPSYGQAWLLNCLVKQLPNSSAVLDFKFSFERKACGRSLKYLWSELAKWVGLNNLPFSFDICSQQEVIKRIHGLWQRHSLILILSKLHEIDEQYVNRFMQEFWLPLSNMASKSLMQSSKHFLLMFLIDNADCVDNWNVHFTEQPDSSWKSHTPIKLKKLTQFSHDVLDSWIEYEIDTLPSDLTSQVILNNSENGIPEFVLDHICSIFGYDWLELVKYRV